MIWSKGAEWGVDQPEEKEDKHATGRDADRIWNVVWNMGELVAKDGTQNDRHKARPLEYWSIVNKVLRSNAQIKNLH